MSSERLRIAWFSSLAGEGQEPTTPAQYASELLIPIVDRVCDVELFHDTYETYRGRKVSPHLKAWQLHNEKPFDLFFYQIEDDRRSYFARIHAALVPGVTWFHHFLLSDFGPEPILNSAWRHTVGLFKGDLATWAPRDAKHEPMGPQAYREGALAGCAVFSNERDHREFRRLARMSVGTVHDRSYCIPLPARVDGVPQSEGAPFSIAFAGGVRIEQRAHVLLEALTTIPTPPILRWLVPARDESLARSMLEEFGIRNAEISIGEGAHAWRDVVCRSSLAIHTLFSVFGQLGPYLNVSTACGVPSVVCNFGQGELLPEALFFKVSYGDRGAAELAQLLMELQTRSLRELGNAVKAYGAETFDAEVVGAELVSVFRATRPRISSLMSKWRMFEERARRSLLAEVSSLAEDVVPGCDPYEAAFSELGWKVDDGQDLVREAV